MKFARLLLAFFLSLGACAHQSTNQRTVATQENAKLRQNEGAVHGQIRDAADGQPLSMVSVQAEVGGKIVADDVSDENGNYRLGPLAPGDYKVTARFSGARVSYEGIVVHEGLETDVKISIDLRPQGDRSTTVLHDGELGAIEGVVLDEVDGMVFPGTVVSLTADHLDDAIMAISDEAGQFQFRSLRPGVYSLSCYYHLVEQGNVELRRGRIVVAPGETTAVQMLMDLRIRRR